MDEHVTTIELEALLLGRHLAPERLSDGVRHLDRSAYTLLTRLAVQGPMSIRELSEAFGLDDSTLNRQTASVVRAGLAERIADPEGGLARKFRVTAAGHERLATERGANIEGIRRVLADWPERDVATLADYLRRLNQAVEQRSGRAWPRDS